MRDFYAQSFLASAAAAGGFWLVGHGLVKAAVGAELNWSTIVSGAVMLAAIAAAFGMNLRKGWELSEAPGRASVSLGFYLGLGSGSLLGFCLKHPPAIELF